MTSEVKIALGRWTILVSIAVVDNQSSPVALIAVLVGSAIKNNKSTKLPRS